jgi:hypothetical protein
MLSGSTNMSPMYFCYANLLSSKSLFVVLLGEVLVEWEMEDFNKCYKMKETPIFYHV